MSNKHQAKISKIRIEDIINYAKDVLKETKKNREELKQKNLEWNELTDARLLFFAQQREIFQSYLLVMSMAKKCFFNLPIWKNSNVKSEKEARESSFVQDRFYWFAEHMKSGLFIEGFVVFETTCRIIAKELGLENFSLSSLAKSLIDETSKNNEHKNLIDIYLFIRNTMHNGGIHNKKTKSITYKEKEYHFIQGKPVDVLEGWDGLFYLSLELISMMREVINTSAVSSISNIVHSYANIEFNWDNSEEEDDDGTTDNNSVQNELRCPVCNSSNVEYKGQKRNYYTITEDYYCCENGYHFSIEESRELIGDFVKGKLKKFL